MTRTRKRKKFVFVLLFLLNSLDYENLMDDVASGSPIILSSGVVPCTRVGREKNEQTS